MITKEFITRIEGHGNLSVDWKKNTVHLHIHEGERLFEGLLIDRTAEEMIWITPRICGVCPVAHNMASVDAVEKALGVEPGPTVLALRELLQCGQMIQSHALHLFFLALPDYLGIDRATELADKDPVAFKRALALKEVSDLIVKVVGGRSVHPVTSVVGGFNRAPAQSALVKLRRKLDASAGAAQWTVDLCRRLKYPDLKVELALVAQSKGSIAAVSSLDIDKRRKAPIENYKEEIEEEVKDYSTAKFGRCRGEVELVGALARLAVSGAYDAEKYGVDFANPFHNNLAQAIEILHYHTKARRIVNKLLKGKMNLAIKKMKRRPPLKGIGATEAPRGGLYHEVHLGKQGSRLQKTITYANIVTPTVQNLTSIEKSARALIDQSSGVSRKKMEKLLVMLVRAYDPCISCSAH